MVKQANKYKNPHKRLKKIIFILVLFFVAARAYTQTEPVILGEDKVDYNNPKEYTIVKTEIEGVTTLDSRVLKLVSGLVEGAKVKVPGEKTLARLLFIS